MAEPADAAGRAVNARTNGARSATALAERQTDVRGPVDAPAVEDEASPAPAKGRAAGERPTPLTARVRVVAAVVGVLALLAFGTAAWFGTEAVRGMVERSDENAAVQAARQVALNLTSIKSDTADADLQRLLDSATGDFRAEFESRAQPFVQIVQQAQVSTTGEIVEAGLASLDGDTAEVLLAVKSQVKNTASAQPEPRNYRLTVTMQHDGGRWLASNVEFVA